MNWITLMASLYHWEPRVDNEIIILSNIKINEYVIKTFKRLKGDGIYE